MDQDPAADIPARTPDSEATRPQPAAGSAGLIGTPFADFTAAAEDMLAALKARSGMQLWMVTRVVADEQVVLVTQDHADSITAVPGQVLPWDSSLCHAMVAGHGPSIAPSVAEVPAYAAAMNGRRAGVQAYVGVPLRREDGQLLGTLCAFDTRPQPSTLHHLRQDVHLKARLLATLLVLELEKQEHQRLAERAQVAAAVDVLTGLANRRAWNEALAREDARCHRHGQSACVVVVDLDRLKEVNDTHGHLAGDELLRSCAQHLRAHARTGDLIARLGGDEFAVLLVECTLDGGRRELTRLREGLQAAGISASTGLGVRQPGGDLNAAWQDADAAMYRDKHSRR